jgi:endonuclease/exonuclease/phosphatase family metal-dependent hydrolase
VLGLRVWDHHQVWLNGSSTIATVTAALVTALAGCADGSPGPAAEEPAGGRPLDLEVLVFNVEYGGGRATDDAMRTVDADVVGVLDSYDRLPEIAEKTGYPFYNVGLQILSKYPIHEPSDADGRYALIEVRPGEVVALFNTHLDYVKFGPSRLRAGRSVDEVIADENDIRTSVAQPLLDQMAELAGEDYPVFLTGDFNQPSSLDYTEATADRHPGVTGPVAWPVSEALLGLGFRDTYREIHPDPVADPGITWDSNWAKPPDGHRIDYVYAGGAAKTTDSHLVGQPGAEGVEVGVEPWTSDHRAVMSTVEVTPHRMPVMVSLDRRMTTQGDEVTVGYRSEERAKTVAVVPTAADSDDGLRLEAPDESGTITVNTSELDPGEYDVRLLDDNAGSIAENSLTVRSPEPDLELTTDRPSYERGEPITVSWTSGPANRWDWVTVYSASAANPEKDDYLIWDYVGGHASGAVPPSVAGELVLGPDSQGGPWPLPPGTYVLHYLLTDQYDSAGRAEFRIIQ